MMSLIVPPKQEKYTVERKRHDTTTFANFAVKFLF